MLMTTRGDTECSAVVDAEAIVQSAWLHLSQCERPAVRRIAPRVHSTTLTLPKRSAPSVGAVKTPGPRTHPPGCGLGSAHLRSTRKRFSGNTCE